MRARHVSEIPIELDKHRGMAAQKATDIRRVLAEVEDNAKMLRDRQGVVEIQLLAVPATSWLEAVAKARYVLNLYSASLAPSDTHHRDLVAAVLADLTRLSEESSGCST
jgi:glutamate/tyrosine decarboxylase-like PLP-dependent enzyme